MAITAPARSQAHRCHPTGRDYYDIVLHAAPSVARTASDVGTGDGLLAVGLPEVTGIDSDADVTNLAQSSTSASVTWITGDALTFGLPEGHHDLVAAVATAHHLPDLAAGLQRLADLIAPGGALVVIGCARSSTLRDYTFDADGVVQHKVLLRTRGYWQHYAPVKMQFQHTYTEVKPDRNDGATRHGMASAPAMAIRHHLAQTQVENTHARRAVTRRPSPKFLVETSYLWPPVSSGRDKRPRSLLNRWGSLDRGGHRSLDVACGGSRARI